MKILSVAGSPYEDNDGEVLNLHVRLDENEIIVVGQMIGIEMMDDSIHETEVKIIEPRYAGDYQAVSRKIAAKVASGEYGTSKKQKKQIQGPCVTDLVVMNVPYHEVKTDEEINARKMIAEMRKKVCVSPFKEIRCGKESIYDYVKDGYTVPDKVIAYLRTTEPYLMSPGIYEHPFKPGTRLLGPYMYTDGHYYWDRDTWKYVVKYHVTLPQEFIDHVMSEEGSAFIEQCIENSDSWSNAIKSWKKKQGFACFLPDNAGDKDLEDF